MTPLKLKALTWFAGGATILTGALLIYVAILRGQLSDAKEVIQGLERWQGQVVATIGLASGNKQLTKDTALVQVQALGQSIAELKNSVREGNTRVEQMAKDLEVSRAAAKAEAKQRERSILNAEKGRDRILTAKPDADIRELQDQAYEAGL